MLRNCFRPSSDAGVAAAASTHIGGGNGASARGRCACSTAMPISATGDFASSCIPRIRDHVRSGRAARVHGFLSGGPGGGRAPAREGAKGNCWPSGDPPPAETPDHCLGDLSRDGYVAKIRELDGIIETLNARNEELADNTALLRKTGAIYAAIAQYSEGARVRFSKCPDPASLRQFMRLADTGRLKNLSSTVFAAPDKDQGIFEMRSE